MSLQFELEAAERFPVVTAAGRDYKAWAKRIIWRKERGDKDLLAIQIKMAEEAVNRGPETP